MSEKLTLMKKIVEIRKGIVNQGGFSKDKKAGNDSFGYSYVSGSQVQAKIISKMNELNVFLYPSIFYDTLKWEKREWDKSSTFNGKTTVKHKVEYLVQFQAEYKWVDADSGEELVVPWFFIGSQEDDISKGFGSAFTYCERYFLLKFFGVPTDADDPDAKAGNNSSNQNKPQQQYQQQHQQQQQPQNKPQQPFQPSGEVITEAQVKRYHAFASKREEGKCKAILGQYGLTSSKQIPKNLYDEIMQKIMKL